MRALVCSMLVLSTAIALQPAFAQSAEELDARINAAMAAAEVQAVRPGDETLTCEQLLAEMGAIEQNPEYLARTAAMNETDLQERGESARTGTALRVVGDVAFGIAASQIPGLGYLQTFMSRDEGEQRQPEEVVSMVQNIEATMPYLMRNQRLYELAQVQQCAFPQQPPAPQEQVPPPE